STPYASSHSRPRAPPESYTLSLHDALPISVGLWPAWLAHRVLGHVHLLPGRELRHPWRRLRPDVSASRERDRPVRGGLGQAHGRSGEHTSELQSRENLVCRLLLEKKKEEIR